METEQIRGPCSRSTIRRSTCSMRRWLVCSIKWLLRAAASETAQQRMRAGLEAGLQTVAGETAEWERAKYAGFLLTGVGDGAGSGAPRRLRAPSGRVAGNDWLCRHCVSGTSGTPTTTTCGSPCLSRRR